VGIREHVHCDERQRVDQVREGTQREIGGADETDRSDFGVDYGDVPGAVLQGQPEFDGGDHGPGLEFVMRKYLPSFLVWAGFLLIMAGIYLWLGLPATLIIGGIWLFLLGAASDIVQNRKPAQPTETKK
jgi:hypothetical protein